MSAMSAGQDAAPVAPGRLWGLGHVLPLIRASRLDYLQSLRRYSEAVRIYLGPNEAYVLNSPELIHRMLVVEAGKFSKGLIFERARPYFGNGILTSNGQFHKRQRRLVQPAFHRDNINRYTTLMCDSADQLAESWRAGQVVAVEQEMHKLATMIIARTLFSGEDAARLAALVKESLPQFVAGVSRRTLMPTALYKLPTPRNRQFDALAVQLRTTTWNLVARYKAEGKDHGDVVSTLLAARDDITGTQMTEDQITDEILTLLFAGIETSATTLTWAYYELGRRPDLRDRLHHEIDTVLAGSPVSGENILELRFTEAFMREILRMYSPIWLLMRRALEPVTLGSTRIPAGAEVIFSPTTLHRDPQLYPDPLRFDPDRWLANETQRLPRCSFIPFGTGNRKCIGESFAWNELQAVLATIGKRWQLKPISKEKIKPAADGVMHIRHLPMIVEWSPLEGLFPPRPAHSPPQGYSTLSRYTYWYTY
jgi:cytochrome P450